MSIDAAAAAAEELKSPATFDVQQALSGQTYPTDTVKIYVNAALAHTMNLEAEEAARLAWESERAFKQAQDMLQAESSIGEPEGYDDKLAEAEAKKQEASEAEAKVARLIEQINSTALTFHMRGLAPKQVELIDKKCRKAIKPPARKNYPQDDDGQEEYELEVWERNKDRNQMVNHECIASSIVKVVNAKGDEDTKVWKAADVDNLQAVILETEYEKLRLKMQDLSFAHTLFNRAIEQDADFLSKP
jgi:hypothetical protein